MARRSSGVAQPPIDRQQDTVAPSAGQVRSVSQSLDSHAVDVKRSEIQQMPCLVPFQRIKTCKIRHRSSAAPCGHQRGAPS